MRIIRVFNLKACSGVYIAIVCWSTVYCHGHKKRNLGGTLRSSIYLYKLNYHSWRGSPSKPIHTCIHRSSWGTRGQPAWARGVHLYPIHISLRNNQPSSVHNCLLYVIVSSSCHSALVLDTQAHISSLLLLNHYKYGKKATLSLCRLSVSLQISNAQYGYTSQ